MKIELQEERAGSRTISMKLRGTASPPGPTTSEVAETATRNVLANPRLTNKTRPSHNLKN